MQICVYFFSIVPTKAFLYLVFQGLAIGMFRQGAVRNNGIIFYDSLRDSCKEKEEEE